VAPVILALRMNPGRISVLEEDRALAEIIPPPRREAARAQAMAATLSVTPGHWQVASEAGRARGGYGLLVLAGMLVRRVGFNGRFGAELLGPGDVLRPWESDGDAGGIMPFEAGWRVLTPTRVALLDAAWAARMAPFPSIGPELTGRATARARRVASLMAIVQLPRLEERLWMVFWELADRFGHVHADGVHLDLPLTHEVLSHLSAARRPSVSGALTRLTDAGRIRREGRDWILTGEPPDAATAGRAAVSLRAR
jgi:CRP-like cAMP-binding protein